jgi:hypothetical protein
MAVGLVLGLGGRRRLHPCGSPAPLCRGHAVGPCGARHKCCGRGAECACQPDRGHGPRTGQVALCARLHGSRHRGLGRRCAGRPCRPRSAVSSRSLAASCWWSARFCSCARTPRATRMSVSPSRQHGGCCPPSLAWASPQGPWRASSVLAVASSSFPLSCSPPACPSPIAIATSLVSITAFGLVTAANYALAGEVVWSTVGLFVAGGIAGGVMGQFAGEPPCLPQAPAAKPLCRRCIGRRCLHDLSGSSVNSNIISFSYRIES